MIEDQTLCVGISIRNILHLNAVLYIQLFLFVGSKGHIGILSVDLILQVIADSHEERLKISNGIDLVINTVHTGEQHQCRCRQGSEHGQHVLRRHARSYQEDHISYHSGNTRCLDQQLRYLIVQAVTLHRIHITLTALAILGYEILLLGRDLHFLDSLYRLGDPFEQTAVIVLIVLTRLIHDRLQHSLDQPHERNQYHCHQNRHGSAGDKAVADDEQRYHTVGQQLQQ